ncbi:DUF2971 domain-containing protein [Bradyrhizobium sp. 4]|uniref:DUF2971 domain-containing protein n=1 Tax=unclassified Bradyrhizobium TaxID=2631580 RepID=UPI001FF8DFAF|nr:MULTISPECIES: DUF2971 domain-containing protein [unclassified Bradyrhizobium]MCK1397098.1 DUF2971 domain-containing protein [Bradyrhizobium sp. 39]MCK1752864.1 DUF2971 domain-containing protein [Bradyrhizobium sp. 135]UPJ37061.1 DUF2971 domain-containing protein [Bradyrhizobium sp. 4]
MLYHYCTNHTFLSIIQTRAIWLSDFTLSNDRLEGKWLRNLLFERCERERLYPTVIERLLSFFDVGAARLGAAGFCMSEEGDLLSQWRGYAGDGGGVSIGFSKEYLEALAGIRYAQQSGEALSLHRIAYSREDQTNLVESILDDAVQAVKAGALDTGSLLTPLEGDRKVEVDRQFRSLTASFLSLHLVQYRAKNPAFSEEREWRLISHILSYATEASALGDLSKMDFRPGHDRIVPFRVLPLGEAAPSCITEVILGPKNITPTRYVSAALERHGWKDVPVRVSAASYR